MVESERAWRAAASSWVAVLSVALTSSSSDLVLLISVLCMLCKRPIPTPAAAMPSPKSSWRPKFWPFSFEEDSWCLCLVCLWDCLVLLCFVGSGLEGTMLDSDDVVCSRTMFARLKGTCMLSVSCEE